MSVDLSIVIPASNAQDIVGPLIQALGGARAAFEAEVEVLVVDDASADLTLARVRALLTGRPWLRLLRVERPEGKGNAIGVGLKAARGRWVALMDADLGYRVEDLVDMWGRARRGEADWFQGRRDPPHPLAAVDRVARPFERLLLADHTADPGCPVRLFQASIAAKLPLQYRGLLRFLPVYADRLGYVVVEHPVRWTPGPRRPGELGAAERLTGALLDLLAVRWMFARMGDPSSVELRLPRRLSDTVVREEQSGPPPRATSTLPPRATTTLPPRLPTGA